MEEELKVKLAREAKLKRCADIIDGITIVSIEEFVRNCGLYVKNMTEIDAHIRRAPAPKSFRKTVLRYAVPMDHPEFKLYLHAKDHLPNRYTEAYALHMKTRNPRDIVEIDCKY